MNLTVSTQVPSEGSSLATLWTFYEDHISSFPDVIQTADIIEITGFSKSAITNWVRSGRLKAIHYKKKFLFPKVYLLEFLTGSYYLSIIRKTDVQKSTLALFHAHYAENLEGGDHHVTR